MSTINELEKLGYTVGLASGSVQVEQDALQVATDAASPDVIISQAQTVTRETLTAISDQGQLPTDPEARRKLVEEIAASAMDALTARADERVEFHQRAVVESQTMPDTWHISGYGIFGYIACKQDGTGWDDAEQAHLDALTDPDLHSERVYQHGHPEAMYASSHLTQLGYTVDRPELGADVFDVDGEQLTAAQIVDRAETAEPKPSAVANLLTSLDNEPSLSDATKKLIRAALNA
jgi:hypothetical protein